jgi:glycosyltransferase involved in cell wall biosynthesis
MDTPLVSVCLPSLNTRPFLQERVDTILGQSYKNWELIVIDGFSEDGSWDFFKELEQSDQRVSIAQAPRGLYAAWNRCIERAQGTYVYIATSDDTMALDCLEKMVAALEEHRDCDLAHCPLVILDRHGIKIDAPEWRDNSMFAFGRPELMTQAHIRRAPIDGLLHLTGRMVYQSITELLIRRTLFNRIGKFSDAWGSIGDLYWEMKAGLVANTVHVPDTWASWRMYDTQGTASVNFYSIEHEQRVAEMIREAVQECTPYLSPQMVTGLRDHWLKWSSAMRTYYIGLKNRPGFLERRLYQISQLRKTDIRAELLGRMSGKPKWPERVPVEIRRWSESLGVAAPITPIL